MSSFAPPLRLRTFGGLSLQHRDHELAGAALQARRLAVLAVIAAAGERGLTRAKLLGIFWPEIDEPRGRQALSQALYALRRDCGTDALVLGTESLRLDPSVITSDIVEFERAVAAGDRERLAALHSAPFLDAVYVAGASEFDRWVDEQRVRYASIAERALEQLAAEADGRGDHAAAAGWWRRLTALDPLGTRAALGVMEALAGAGHRAEALRHGEQYARALREALDTEPSAAVVALTERLRAQGGESTGPAALGGRYLLEREIGRGGMAVVFLARDLRHGRPVAIKMLHPELGATLGRDRLAREIVVTAGLRHPHILPLFDSGDSEGTLYYVMPYVEGESLRSRLVREGALPISEATQLAREVAEALHHAHEHGVLHRDVKPENVLLSEGHAVVMDFGIARQLSAADAETLTQHGLVLGTPAYMSPEQITGDAEIDARSDVFSLGCVLFEMLTGRPPWMAANAQSLLAKRFVEQPPQLRTLRPEAPEALATELRRALAADPAERHATAAAFATALGEAVVTDRARHADTATARLPAPTGSMIGRARELEAARALITRPDVRLLTFTGAGGSGKTTLALHLASQVEASFADGARFVDLTAVSDATRVLPALADALGTREREGQSPFASVAAWLGEREILLVLDNLERVASTGPELMRLLAACPRLTIVVTSRVRLRVRGENEFFVAPLAVPEAASASPEALRQSPAVDLFLRRAAAARPDLAPNDDDLAAIGELCRRLDGLPLAIELAAARCRLLSPRALLARIDHRFDILTGGARDLPSRQQTLAGAIAWSYELLPAREQAALRHLGVFAGGATLGSFAAVLGCSDDDALAIAEGLADASLLRHSEDTTGETRLVLLESVHAYALDRLREQGEEGRVRTRHLDWFAGVAELLSGELRGAKQGAALAALDRERDNFRLALAHAEGQGERLARLVAALWRAWLVRGQWTEGREWIARALAAGPEMAAELRAELLAAAATLAQNQGDYQAAYGLAERARSLWNDAADRAGEARTLASMGWLAWRLCRFDEARRLSEESLAMHRALADQSGVAQALNNLGWVALFRGDAQGAAAHLEESLAIRRTLGEQRNVAFTATTLGWALSRLGERTRARRMLADARAAFEAIGERQLLAFNVRVSAADDVAAGDAERAIRELEAVSVPIFREIGDRWGLCVALGILGDALLVAGRVVDAERAHGESLTLATAIGDRIWIAAGLARRATAAEARGEHREAIELADRVDTMLAEVDAPLPEEVRAAFTESRERARSMASGASA